ncbi:MAG: sigma-54-dependent Fis family transcriptional regulator [Gemmatimonadetes bacterium]|nr:sigma-54-dependent Fis family transcriptional regulator [Gemmatimonadota bacterium]
MSTTGTILVIDDDDAVTASLALLLKQSGFASACVATPGEALEQLESRSFDAVLQDMNFTRKTTGEEGLALLIAIRERRPDVPVILMTAWGSIELAVEGIRAGAQDFITKPWNNAQMLLAIRTALGPGRRGGVEEPGADREELASRYDLSGVVGESPAFLRAIGLAAKVAATDASVLVTGESGTGKEVVAEFLHRNSRRRDAPLVKVNLGGIPRTLFESEMFGHRKGAFTDAHQDREGRFARAEGGTILLDEIGELDPACQVKMLRVLQERTFEVLGDSRPRPLDVRVISATNRDLERAVREGRFREDLYYRINLITIRLPRLEERRGDIPLLARHFARQAAREYDRPGLAIREEALQWLAARPWPGHVRQLRHFVERTALVAERSDLGLEDVRRTGMIDEARGAEASGDWTPPVGQMTVEEMERAMIVKSLGHHEGNLSRVAESLGLSRAALYRRLEKFGIRT